MARRRGSATPFEVNMAFTGDNGRYRAREVAKVLQDHFPTTYVNEVGSVEVVDDSTSDLSTVSAIIIPKHGSKSVKRSLGWVGQIRAEYGGRVHTPDSS